MSYEFKVKEQKDDGVLENLFGAFFYLCLALIYLAVPVIIFAAICKFLFF